MRVRLGACVLVLLIAVTGCGGGARPGSESPGGGFASGDSAQVITVGGVERSFIVHRPAASAPAAGYPLVVMLHGGLGSAAQAGRAYGWNARAEAAGFVVAYPDGLDRAWNAGSCCGLPARRDTDDVGFITAMVARIGTGMPVDPDRVFATGMSNGAMMAYRLACETTLFAAVAAVSGDQLVSCAGASPVSLLHIHGTADTNVPLDGSPGTGPGRVDGPPVADVIGAWRTRDGCGTVRATTTGGVTTRTADCADGREVELALVSGGGHQWPLWATGAIWDFFAAHPRR